MVNNCYDPPHPLPGDRSWEAGEMGQWFKHDRCERSYSFRLKSCTDRITSSVFFAVYHPTMQVNLPHSSLPYHSHHHPPPHHFPTPWPFYSSLLLSLPWKWKHLGDVVDPLLQIPLVLRSQIPAEGRMTRLDPVDSKGRCLPIAARILGAWQQPIHAWSWTVLERRQTSSAACQSARFRREAVFVKCCHHNIHDEWCTCERMVRCMSERTVSEAAAWDKGPA